MPRRRLLFAAALAAGSAGGEVLACAVATTVRVENRSTQRVREIRVAGPDRGGNQAPAAGLAPGEVAMVTLPSCLGTYDIAVVYADGRGETHRGLNAMTIRGLVLR